MKKFWKNSDGKILTDDQGKIYFCEDCPCESAQVIFSGSYHSAFSRESWGAVIQTNGDSSWNFTGNLSSADISPAGSGQIILSGTWTTTQDIWENREWIDCGELIDTVTDTVSATLTYNFGIKNNYWYFPNLPLIGWVNVYNHQINYSSTYFGIGTAPCGADSIFIHSFGDYYTCGVTEAYGQYFPCDDAHEQWNVGNCPISKGTYYTLTIDTNNEIAYDGVTNFPIGTKSCSWHSNGDTWGSINWYGGRIWWKIYWSILWSK